MKTLVVCRHAKSSWKYPVDDFYRPLNRRGLHDGVAMASLKPLTAPQLILCSPAVRTYSTAIAYIREQNWDINCLKLLPDIYEAQCRDLLSRLVDIDDQLKNVWLFGHNPGINELLGYLLQRPLENLVTAGVVELELNIVSWRELLDWETGESHCRLCEWAVPVKNND